MLVLVEEDGLENPFPRQQLPSLWLNVPNINLLYSTMDIIH